MPYQKYAGFVLVVFFNNLPLDLLCYLNLIPPPPHKYHHNVILKPSFQKSYKKCFSPRPNAPVQ